MSTGTWSFGTTMDYGDHAVFERRARLVTDRRYDSGGVVAQARALWDILAVAAHGATLLLDSSAGSLHPDLLAAALLGFVPPLWRPPVVLMGCMWERRPGVRGLAQRLAIRLADRGISRYAVQTRDELCTFPEIWGVDPVKLRFVPYFWTMDEADLDGATIGDHVFAGGNSHRDYEPLLAAAESFPDTRFVLATNRLESAVLPANVEAGPVPHARFVELMQTARLVVVPLRPGLARGAGQQTYLNAMAMGKAVVVPDVAGVRNYVTAGVTGLVCEPSPTGYSEALAVLLGPGGRDLTMKMGDAARAASRPSYTYQAHVDRLLEVLEDVPPRGPRSLM
jgi:glycosyltransferase involved in cell wall biosynthesis